MTNPLNQKIISNLSTKFPGHTFELMVEIDRHSFAPIVFLTVDGKKTPYGYNPDVYQSVINQKLQTEDSLVENFVRGVNSVNFL